MPMTEKIFFNEDKNEFAILQFNYIQLVTTIEVNVPSKLINKHRELCTYPLTREEAIKKAKEIYIGMV